MNYPVWIIPGIGGGLLIAIISIIHVYVSHFAVGGSLFLILSEIKAHREKSRHLLEYTKRHTKFFLLLTLVFGNVTGVGIWFSISLVNPYATSRLIHIFVFGWAIEWIFFTLEIVSLFLYYYTFEKLSEKDHLIIGWLYFIFAWCSLFIINGIVTFMLTPGKWTETGSFWHGFFNPSFLPSLFFRSTISILIAGIFGLITTHIVLDKSSRQKMYRYCSGWITIPIVILPFVSVWYLNSIGSISKHMVLGGSPEIVPFVRIFIWIMPVIFMLGILINLIKFRIPATAINVLLLISGLIYMGCFEWIRESARRPYVIYNSMYSNSIPISDKNAIMENGYLKTAKWVDRRVVQDKLRAGEELFNHQCLSCHSVGGIWNNIIPKIKKYRTLVALESLLKGQGKLNSYMPPFLGTPDEMSALANYMLNALIKPYKKVSVPIRLPSIKLKVPEFREEQQYIILAWPVNGIALRYDNRYFEVKTPDVKIRAIVIRRDESPEIISNDIEIYYALMDKMNSKKSTEAKWRRMRLIETENAPFFESPGLKLSPFKDDEGFNPYPVIKVVAVEKNRRIILAKTICTAPISTETGCGMCHGGYLDSIRPPYLSDETAIDIIKTHDRISKTELIKKIRHGKKVKCHSCHDSKKDKKQGPMDLSSAIHGFHAIYIGDIKGACNLCHPTAPDGWTRAFRGVHGISGMRCSECHGSMVEHSISLLLNQRRDGRAGAQKLLNHLLSNKGKSILPRRAWMDTPDCLSCHEDYGPPGKYSSGFNKFSEIPLKDRTDDAGILCMACHGTMHALYPSNNPYSMKLENIQPLQYQGKPYPIGANRRCSVCHTVDMDEEFHHPNSLGMMRTQGLSEKKEAE